MFTRPKFPARRITTCRRFVTLLNNLLAWFVYESSLRYPKPEARGGETASNAGKKKQRAIFNLMDGS